MLAFVAGREAEANCPGVKMDMTRLALLRAESVRDQDEPAVEAAILRAKASTEMQIARKGVAQWCGDVADLFGAHGSMVPGIISFFSQ